MASAAGPVVGATDNTREPAHFSSESGQESRDAQSQPSSSTPIEMHRMSPSGQVDPSSTTSETNNTVSPTTAGPSQRGLGRQTPDGGINTNQAPIENVSEAQQTQLHPPDLNPENHGSLAPAPQNQDDGPNETSQAPLTREKTSPAIGPSTDRPSPVLKESEIDGPVLYITLLLITGARHPFRLDQKYLKKRNVEVEDNNPVNMSLYKLKELIWRDWRDEWEARPSSPESIRLISMGRLLSDKSKLSELGFKNVTTPTIVHMTIKPQEIVDEEDAKSNAHNREGNERSPGCRCVIQ